MSNLRSIIRELVEEVMTEMTGTGAVAGYATPFAFQGNGDAAKKKKIAARSIPGGKVVDEEVDEDGNEKLPIVRRDPVVSEGRGRYHNFKESDMMKTHAKISYGIQQSHKMLTEVDFLLGLCERLKTESGVDDSSLWKRTTHDVRKIHGRLKEIAKRINRINRVNR